MARPKGHPSCRPQVVLGFDHYCGWLGVPIGLHNRKGFLLFLSYCGCLSLIASRILFHFPQSKLAEAAAGNTATVTLLVSPAYMLFAACGSSDIAAEGVPEHVWQHQSPLLVQLMPPVRRRHRLCRRCRRRAALCLCGIPPSVPRAAVETRRDVATVTGDTPPRAG